MRYFLMTLLRQFIFIVCVTVSISLKMTHQIFHPDKYMVYSGAKEMVSMYEVLPVTVKVNVLSSFLTTEALIY